MFAYNVYVEEVRLNLGSPMYDAHNAIAEFTTEVLQRRK